MIALALAYQLAFVIDGRTYISAHHLTHGHCRAVLRSVRTDPDSFRHGYGVYYCQRER